MEEVEGEEEGEEEKDIAIACHQVRAVSSGTHCMQELSFSSSGFFRALPQQSATSPIPL